MLTVQGINLGKKASDLLDGVIVAGVKCQVQEEGYKATTQFVCLTGGSINSLNGTVNVTVSEKYTASSEDLFAYKVNKYLIKKRLYTSCGQIYRQPKAKKIK